MQLYKHQLDIINEDKKKCGLFLGTGSAKTLTALHLAQGKILVITPKINNEEKNFIRENEKFSLGKDIVQMSKEQFKKYAGDLKRFDTVIVDESHTMAGITPSTRSRNRQIIPRASQLYEVLLAYLRRTNPERIYLLTATPVRNPMTVYGHATLLGANWDFYKFRDTFYFVKKKGYIEFWIPRSDKTTKERLGAVVNKIGYTGQLSNYFDVPEQIYKTIKVEPTKEQTQKIEEAELDYPNPIVLIGKQHQIENGIYENEIIKDNKMEVLEDLVLEFPKIIFIAKYTNQIEKIKGHFKDKKVIVISGQTKNRNEAIAEAEKLDECIVIIQSQVSAGYELPNFPTMVFVSMSYSVVDRIQAEGRILRANHLKKNLYITLITTGGIDEAVLKSINNKTDFNEKIYAENRSK